jgi:hypothetical protein
MKEYKSKNPKELLLSIQSVVKNRNGSVLARQLILKSDRFDTGILVFNGRPGIEVGFWIAGGSEF